MAVVFISPKQRQRTFFMIITVIFLLFLVFVSLAVFFSKPKEVLQALVFNKPKVNIDMSIFDSDQFKGLQPLTEMEIQYSYTAVNRANKTETGFISAASIDQARKALEDRGLTVSELKEAEIGRDNPFIPYYQVLPATTTKTR